MLSVRIRHRYPSGFGLDLAFDAHRRVTALFGPSGSGKTSVIEAVAGLRRPDDGRIALDGRPLLDTAAAIDLPPQRRRVGVVFQDGLLFPHLTVERNLRYGRRRPGARPVQFDRVVEVLDLVSVLRRYPPSLSGGERQRVALGRALLSGPDLLLLDEPLAALDEPLKQRILAHLGRVLQEWEIPALFVSHAQADVRRLAEWVVVLEKGRVVAQGAPDDALADPQLLARRDEAGPVNLLRIDDLQRVGDHWLGRIDSGTLQLPPAAAPPAPPVFVQFPPSAVLLSREDIPGISARNHLRGVVRRIVELPEGAFVAVDVGQILWAVVTPDALRDLALAPGAPVTCLIKTYSLEVLD